MAVSRIGTVSLTPQGKKDTDEDMKPLVREYGKENPSIYQEAHSVISGRISKSGEWCMLHTEDYVLLIKASATAVQELYNQILPQVNGKKANQLVIEPVKKDRYGGCIGVDDEATIWYDFDEKSLEFTCTPYKVDTVKKSQTSLTIGMFLDTKDGSDSSPTQTDSDKNSTSTDTGNIHTRRKKNLKPATDTTKEE